MHHPDQELIGLSMPAVFIMMCDDNGEGGTFALYRYCRSAYPPRKLTAKSDTIDQCSIQPPYLSSQGFTLYESQRLYLV